MTNWKEYKLGEIAVITTGYSFKGNRYTNKGIRVVRGENVTIGNLRWDTIKCWNDDFDQFEKYSLKEGDIVIGMDGSRVGKNRAQISKSDLPLLLAQRVACVRAKTGFSQDLIAYLIKSPKFEQYVEMVHTGTSIPHISQKQIEEFNVYLTNDLHTQNAIAEILSSLDDKIELNNKINQELENLAQTLFKQWFIDFEFPDENGNPYRSSGGEMVDSELGDIPNGWKVGIFKDHIEILRGLSYKGNGLSDSETGIPMVNLNSIFEGGGYKYEGIKYYSGIYKEKNIIEPWDLAVANTEQGHKYMLIGYPAYIPKSLGKVGIFSHHIYKVKTLNSTHLTNQFFYFLIKSSQIRDQIIGACNGTTVNMLKINGLETPKFAIPEKNLISSFTSIACNVWEAIENNHLLNEQLKDLRDTLLPKLISGELEINNVNI